MLGQEIPLPWLDFDNLKEKIMTSKLEEKEEVALSDKNVWYVFSFSTNWNSPSQALPVFVVI